MNRRLNAIGIIALLLAGCGGGGSKGGFTPSAPTAPTSTTKTPGTVTLSFKIPNQTTMSRIRRPAYVSQATAGVGINWTTTNANSPDYSAPITAGGACPGSNPTGVTSCTVTSTGTVYTFQLSILPGTYPNFLISTFDQAPSGGSFASAHMLAQGSITGGVTVAAGQTNTLPSITFWGVPASVSVTPGAGQAHIISSTGGYQIIGNTTQTFFVQALDADGFAITSNTGNGGPTLSLTENDSGGYLSAPVQSASSAFAFSLHAVSIPANLSTPAQLKATATQAGVTPTAAVDALISVTVVPELWVTMQPGPGGNIYGFALNESNFGMQYSPIDSITTSYLPGPLAVDNSGNLWVSNATGTTIQLYTAGSNSNAPIQATTTISGSDIVSLAVDGNNNLWIADATAAGGNGEFLAYNINTPSSPTAESYNTVTEATQADIMTPSALAVAPNSSSIISALRGSIWVASTEYSAVDVFTPGTSKTSPIHLAYDQVLTNDNYADLAIAPDGTLWTWDNSTLGGVAQALASSGWQSAIQTPIGGSTPQSPGDQMSATPYGVYFNGLYGAQQFAISGCPDDCSVAPMGNGNYSSYTPAGGTYVAP